LSTYKILDDEEWQTEIFKIVPIRRQDRYDIMKWRNEQIYHLRQAKPLTKEDQDYYFSRVVAGLFEEDKPEQILFSFLQGDQCLGYGGLVHINWQDRNAELSFIMQTDLENEQFSLLWTNYLELIERVAFDCLNFHRIFTFAIDLRPHLYPVIQAAGFIEEARLREHVYFDNEFVDVVIHGKLNPNE